MADKAAKKRMRAAKRARVSFLNEPPVRSLLEEIGNSITHGVGAGLAIAAFILMLVKSDTGLKIMASCFYGISMILMFLMSCLYHAFRCGSLVKKIWRRFDYSSIYLLIGGTFAPFLLVYWGDVKGIVLFCVQWGLIITGISLIGVFGPGKFKLLHYTLYLVIGWSGLMFLPDFFNNAPTLFYAVLGGGVIYTLGMIPFIKDTKGAHFIWHIFVLGGAAAHWFAIFFSLYLA